MWIDRLFTLVLVLIGAVCCAFVMCRAPEASGVAPPPYNDTNTPINQGLGGIGRTQGWTVVGASGDLFSDSEISAIGAAFKADVEAPSTSAFMRKIVIRRVYDSAGAGKPACVRLGPETNTPTLTCDDVSNENQTGGCYLRATGDSCAFLWRPIKDCTTWDTCRPFFWYDMNGAGTVGLEVAISW